MNETLSRQEVANIKSIGHASANVCLSGNRLRDLCDSHEALRRKVAELTSEVNTLQRERTEIQDERAEAFSYARDMDGACDLQATEHAKEVEALRREVESLKECREQEFHSWRNELIAARSTMQRQLDAMEAERDAARHSVRGCGVEISNCDRKYYELNAEAESLKPDAERWKYLAKNHVDVIFKKWGFFENEAAFTQFVDDQRKGEEPKT